MRRQGWRNRSLREVGVCVSKEKRQSPPSPYHVSDVSGLSPPIPSRSQRRRIHRQGSVPVHGRGRRRRGTSGARASGARRASSLSCQGPPAGLTPAPRTQPRSVDRAPRGGPSRAPSTAAAGLFGTPTSTQDLGPGQGWRRKDGGALSGPRGGVGSRRPAEAPAPRSRP